MDGQNKTGDNPEPQKSSSLSGVPYQQATPGDLHIQHLTPEERALAARKPRWGVIAGVVALHIVLVAGLVRAFAPQLPGQVVDAAVSLVSIDVTPRPEPEPVPQSLPNPAPDEGAAAEAGKQANPRDAAVPPVAVPRPNPTPAPPVASTGTQNSAGASESGTGQGAGGTGDGLGSGRGGAGRGGVPVTKPEKIAGDINSASDFPTPPGGRQTRWGKQLIVSMTVGVDGRASNCRVVEAGPDAEAGAITCRLAVERFRFRPARDALGEAVPSTYGWRQWWAGPRG